MSERDDGVYIGHMLVMAQRALRLLADKDRSAYYADEALRLALLHLVQTIGEAAQHVSASTREAHPTIPWSQIVGMRHKLVHDYMGVDEEMLWKTIRDRIPQLVAELEKIVPPEDPGAQTPP